MYSYNNWYYLFNLVNPEVNVVKPNETHTALMEPEGSQQVATFWRPRYDVESISGNVMTQTFKLMVMKKP